MKSLSEIDTTSKRSSRAIGYSWGISEEVGKNIRLLEMFGLPGVKNLNEFYKKKRKKNFENVSVISKKNKSKKYAICPIFAGVSFLDQIINLENLKEIKFTNMAYPLLFLPFVSRASEIIGKRLYLKIDNKNFLLNFNTNIYSKFKKKSIIKLAKNISVEFLQNKDSFSKNEWKELYLLSEESFVKETDSLKKVGAGAGLTDND
tara:strand:- start:362 stop:973 length:612 start_codon:yes stop_codon:yes gene_type:complete